MGLIFKQTYKNVIFTYVGVLFGAVNILFLYPLYLKDTYYGLVAFLGAFANLLMPLFVMGVQNGLIKFYTSFSDQKEQQGFVFLMFILPLLVSIPIGVIFWLFYSQIVGYISSFGNSLTAEYFWLVYFMGLSYAYFEVFYTWSKTHMQSIYGNFLKEVFHRVFVTIFLVLVYYNKMTPHQFVLALVSVFGARTLLMLLSAIKTKKPKFYFRIPKQIIRILKYNFIMLVLGFFTILLMSADKVFIGKMLTLKEVAYYSVAVFISSLVAIPSKSMHHITNTITANLLNDNNVDGLNRLYKDTAINLYVVSGFIFLIITLNIHELYRLIEEGYEKNLGIVIILSCARLLENVMGNNNSIIFNSNYFRLIFKLLITMTVFIIVSLYFFTSFWGVYGTALAVFSTYVVYHGVKLWMVYKYFGIHPFSYTIKKITLVLIIFMVLFYFWDFSTFSPILNMALKSTLITLAFVFCLWRFSLSEKLKDILKKMVLLFN